MDATTLLDESRANPPTSEKDFSNEVAEDVSSKASSISDASGSNASTAATSTTSQDAAKDGYTTYYPHPTAFKLGDHPIDDVRPLRVRAKILPMMLITAD